MEILSLLVGFVLNNAVGLGAGAVLGWIIPQPSFANKFVSFVAPFVNRGFALGRALVIKYKNFRTKE